MGLLHKHIIYSTKHSSNEVHIWKLIAYPLQALRSLSDQTQNHINITNVQIQTLKEDVKFLKNETIVKGDLIQKLDEKVEIYKTNWETSQAENRLVKGQ